MPSHRKGPHATETDETIAPEGVKRPHVVEDDDVSGHSMQMIQGGADPRNLARERQRDIKDEAGRRSLADRLQIGRAHV